MTPRIGSSSGSYSVAAIARFLPMLLQLLLPLLPLAIAGCATPASDVRVPTMPMRDALAKARTQPLATAGAATPAGEQAAALSTIPADGPIAVPRPALAAPDVRLAWLFDWVDAEGNRHYGSWVAIPVTSARWILSDGATVPIAVPRPATTPSGERQ